MIREVYKLMDRTFSQKGDVPEEVNEVLIDGETAHYCYEAGNDCVVFTDKRFIFKDERGKKTAVYSVPYKNVIIWSSENAGKIDFNAEITLWTVCEKVKINLGKDADIRGIDKMLSENIL